MEFNETALLSAGIFGLPSNITRFILEASWESLEQRVGIRLAAKLTSEKLNEAADIMDREDDDASRVWLEAHLPDYRETVGDELQLLMNDLGTNSAALRILLRS